MTFDVVTESEETQAIKLMLRKQVCAAEFVTMKMAICVYSEGYTYVKSS